MKVCSSLAEDLLIAVVVAATLVLFLLLFACATPQPNARPWPCERFRENPEVYAELMLMKHTEEAFLWDSRSALSSDAVYFKGEGGIFPETRKWVAKADAKCAADRALVGEPVDQREKLSWWERSWLGRLLRWPARNP